MLAYEESKSCQELEGNACSPPLGGDPDETRVYPFRFLYDTDDVRHVSPFPWPGLRKLVWPDAHEMLPKGVGEDLLAAYSEIAAEAAAATSPADSPMAQQGDAYESIAADKKWTKLVLYDARAGWNEELCKNLGTVCRLLRGKFRTEQEPLRSAYQTGLLPYGDEAVILFRVAAGGTAPLHMGQDARINVHLCLLNCNSSQIAVGGDLRNYSDSSLFAFEDRADHEIINHDRQNDRISLTIGVLHPDFSLQDEPYPAPQQVVRMGLAHPAKEGRFSSFANPALVMAAYYGYAGAVKELLEQGTAVDATDRSGTAAIHACLLGIDRKDDNTVRPHCPHPDSPPGRLLSAGCWWCAAQSGGAVGAGRCDPGPARRARR